MLLPFAGYDRHERQIVPRGPASRFSADEIEAMKELARSGASGVEIAHQLGHRAEAIRAKLWRLGYRLRQKAAKSKIRMTLRITRRMREAASRRGISVQQLVHRLLRTISANDLFDEVLGRPFRSLGAAAIHEPAAGRADRAAVADAGSSVGAATFSVVSLRTPQLSGCCARLG